MTPQDSPDQTRVELVGSCILLLVLLLIAAFCPI